MTCSSDYYHYNDECVSEQDCNDKQGHYAVNKTNEGICDECHPTCDSCTGSAFNECDGCQPPRMLFNGICCDQSCKECSSPYGNDCLACMMMLICLTQHVLRNVPLIEASSTIDSITTKTRRKRNASRASFIAVSVLVRGY